MSLQTSYTFIAPFYDLFISQATLSSRKRSLSEIADAPASRVLIAGIGTGLDLPHLPTQHAYVGVDLTSAMLKRGQRLSHQANIKFVQGSVTHLPFPDASFDTAILHLILAVVPDPVACLGEISRVLRPNGSVLIFDKFLRPGERALAKRFLNRLSRHVATRVDVVFEAVLQTSPSLSCDRNEPTMGGNWFRLIKLRKSRM